MKVSVLLTSAAKHLCDLKPHLKQTLRQMSTLNQVSTLKKMNKKAILTVKRRTLKIHFRSLAKSLRVLLALRLLTCLKNLRPQALLSVMKPLAPNCWRQQRTHP